MLEVALAVPLSLAAVLVPLCRYLTARDTREAAERTQLLQRIQAPELAVAQHATEEIEIPVHLPFDDDSAWTSYQDDVRERVARG